MSHVSNFSLEILKLVDESDLTLREKRRARFAIHFRPRMMEQAEAASVAALAEENPSEAKAIGDGERDWTAFGEFLKVLFEILLKFILGLG